ncbi:hypothetical protein LCGC14_2750120, partial [marine sediment metagenome]
AKLVKTFGKAELAPVGRAPINLVSYKDNDIVTQYNYIDNGDDTDGDGNGDGLNDNTVYYYKIRTVDFIAEENDTFYAWTVSSVNKETADISPPAAPEALSVVDLFPKWTINTQDNHPIMMAAWPHIDDRYGHGVANDETFYEYRLYRSTNTNFSSGDIIYQGTNNFYRDEILTGSADNVYYYKVTAADGTDNGGVNNEDLSAGPLYGPINPANLDKTAPAIDNRVVSIQASSATINLNLDESSETKVLFGSGGSCSNLSRSVGTAVNATSAAIQLKKLTPGSTYSYRILTADSIDNKRTSACYTFSTPAFALSSVEKSASVSSATLKWKANANADSFIKYTNTKTKETRIVANDAAKAANAEHSLALKGLSSGTKYTYTLISKDEYSNRATKAGSFTTDKFKATKVSVSTTVSSAIVTWKTNV